MEVNAKTFVELVNSGKMNQSEKFGTWFSSTDKQDGKQLIDDLKMRYDNLLRTAQSVSCAVARRRAGSGRRSQRRV